MKRSDGAVLAGLGLLVVAIVFWVAILGPKRSHASDLSNQITQLQASVSQMEQTAAAAQQERSNFAASYHKLVVLGKAVPAESDQSSLLVQLNSLSGRAGINFENLDLSSDTSGAAAAEAAQAQSPALLQPGTSSTSPTSTAAPTATTGTATTPTTTTPSTTGAAPTATATPSTSATAAASAASSAAGTIPAASTSTTPATETAAATTPLGSTVGPAGLPIMPYKLSFSGSFFNIADFLHSLDSLVHTRHGGVSVSGRLLTVDGFSLTTASASSPSAGSTASGKALTGLEANLAVTTYLTPPDQGVTGGATPAGPPTATAPGTTVPTAAPTSTTTATP